MYKYMPSNQNLQLSPNFPKLLQCSILCFLNVMIIHMYMYMHVHVHVYACTCTMYLWNIFNTCNVLYQLQSYKPPEATSGNLRTCRWAYNPPPMRIRLCTIFCCLQDKIPAHETLVHVCCTCILYLYMYMYVL